MDSEVLEVIIKGVLPTHSGSAVFLGNSEKTFVIYVDQGIGNVISMGMEGVRKDRPLTHDLMGMMLKGFGAERRRVIINDVDEGTYYARIFLEMENELGRKLLELDARPSVSMALALVEGVPIHVTQKVYDEVEDMTEILDRILKQQG